MYIISETLLSIARIVKISDEFGFWAKTPFLADFGTQLARTALNLQNPKSFEIPRNNCFEFACYALAPRRRRISASRQELLSAVHS